MIIFVFLLPLCAAYGRLPENEIPIGFRHVIGKYGRMSHVKYTIYTNPLPGEPTAPAESYENYCGLLGTHFSYPQPGFWGRKVWYCRLEVWLANLLIRHILY